MNHTSIEPALRRLAVLENAFRSGHADPEELRQYCELAIAAGRLENARQTLACLKDSHPKDIHIHSLFIALCLRQGDDAAALAAIEFMAARINLNDEFLDAALAVRLRLGPMKVKQNDSHSITLCMIARNEGASLASCLSSIKPLVDEMILVDTGSSDRTADIGRVFGARVHEFKWCNDFSAARNFSLSKASSRWVLVLDADEAIAPSDFEALRMLVRRHANQAVAFAIETRNYCYTANALGLRANEGRYPLHEAGWGWYPSTKVRLFKRENAIRFHFPVHERVEPSLGAAGIRIAACRVPVHHYGCLNESRNRDKARRYYELGVAKLGEMGDDPAAIRELAVQAGQLERWPEAIGLWRRLLDLRPGYPEALINMASAHWQLGDYRESLTWTEKALARDATLKEAHFNRALSFMMLGDFHQTIAILEPLLQGHPDYMAAIFMLSVAYACSARKKEALTLIGRLQRTAAAAAIAGALEDVSRRLQSAGHDDAILQMKAVFYEPTPADAHPNRV